MERPHGEILHHISEAHEKKIERFIERFRDLETLVLEQYDFLVEQERQREELLQAELAKPEGKINLDFVSTLQDELEEIARLQGDLDTEMVILHGKEDILRDAWLAIADNPDEAKRIINELGARIDDLNLNHSLQGQMVEFPPGTLDSKPENDNNGQGLSGV